MKKFPIFLTLCAFTSITLAGCNKAPAPVYFTVSFKNYDGTLLSESTVQQGYTVEYGGVTPTRGETAEYTYTFTGWDQSLENIQSNCVRVAQYSENLKPVAITYTVTFKNYDGTVLCEDIVEPGGTATYSLQNDPTRPETSEATYTFNGWDQPLTNITSDSIRVAQYTENLKPAKYTVSFRNYDGTVLHEVYVTTGGTATYEWPNPTREEDEDYTYSFKGWDQPLTNITEDCIRVATYNETAKPKTTYYTVTFKNYDGSYLTEAVVAKGETAVYGLQDNPSRPSTSEFIYTFKGWNQPLTNIQSDCTRYAQYNAEYVEYTVQFYSYDNQWLYTASVHYQEPASYYGPEPTKPATSTHYYTFEGWDKNLSCITKSITTKPVFAEHGVEKEVVIYPNNGDESEELKVTYGQEYSFATPTYPGFTFAGWFINDTQSIPSSGTWTYTDVTSVTAKWETGYFNFADNGDNTVTVSLTELGKKASEIIIPSEFEGKPVTTLGTNFATNNTNITKVTIPGTIKDIPSESFSYCSSLEEVNFNEGLLTIGQDAFERCSKLKKVAFPKTLTTIDRYAFYYATSLYQIFIPKSVTTINQYAFSYIGSKPYACIEAQELPSGWSSDWASSVTYYLGSIKIVDTDEYTYVYRSLYGDKTASILRLTEATSELLDFTVPTQIEDATDIRVAPYLFQSNKYIRNVDLTGVTRIGSSAFESCSNLQTVTFSESLTLIGSNAFQYCSSLKEVDLPNGLTEIGSSAFYSCSALTYIYIPASVVTIGNYAFYSCNSSTIYTGAHTAGSGWSETYKGSQMTYVDFVSLSETEDFTYVKQSYLGDERITLTGVKDSAKLKKNIVIPNEIEGISDIRIGTKIFYQLTNLVSIDLGPVKSIPSNCFQYCSNLETVILHEGLTTINSYAFSNCPKLSSINIPSTLTTIGRFAFDYCSSLGEIYIPISVTSIGSYAFADTGSLSILMESSIKQSGWEDNWYGSYQTNRQFIYDYVSSGTIGDFRYAKTSNGVTDNIYILGLTKESTNLNLVVPDQIEGITNIKIAAYAFNTNSNIKTVDLGNSVISVLTYAFGSCTSLAQVIIPASCSVIKVDAFYQCKTTCVLNCVAESQPSGWETNWNRSGCQVVWGYTR